MLMQASKTCAEAGRQDGDAKLRALQLLRNATRPLYASLFVPISNQPGGEHAEALYL